METVEEERKKALEYLADCYARDILDLHGYEDHRDQVMAAQSVPGIREAIRSVAGPGQVRQRPGKAAAPEQTALCIMGTRKLAPARLEEEARTFCVMGDVVIDLRRTDLNGSARIQTVTIMGDTVIRVPGNAIVHNDITAIMADVKDKDAPDPPERTGEPEGPEIFLTGVAIMADVKIRRR